MTGNAALSQVRREHFAGRALTQSEICSHDMHARVELLKERAQHVDTLYSTESLPCSLEEPQQH